MSRVVKYGLIGLAIFVSGFGVGTFLRPGSKTQTQVTNTQENKHTQRNIVTTIKRERKPDGTQTTTVVKVDKSHDETQTHTQETNKTETTRGAPATRDWQVSGGILGSLDGQRDYWGMVQRRVLGEIYIGAMGTSRGQAGVGITIRF